MRRMANCYEITLECEESDPLLPSVECAVVLTMTNSKRLTKPTFDGIKKLCRRTYVQRNPGYNTCPKPDWVQSSYMDLVHAYKNVCEEFRNVRGNILILEDDAQLMPGTSRLDFDRVDRFLLVGKYDLYTLGSLGWIHHINRHHARVHGCCSQAIIWTPWVRERLSLTSISTHIDNTFINRQLTITYKTPLVVQLFPETENRSQWCVFCTPRMISVDKLINNIHVKFVRFFHMDIDTRHWKTMYTLSKLVPVLYVMVCVSACVGVGTRMHGSKCRFEQLVQQDIQ